MNDYDCPKFESCSAPVCALDTEWHKRPHLKGERVCFFITELVKEASRPLLRGCLAAEHYQAIEVLYPLIIASHPLIKRQLERSSNNASRIGKLPWECKTKASSNSNAIEHELIKPGSHKPNQSNAGDQRL